MGFMSFAKVITFAFSLAKELPLSASAITIVNAIWTCRIILVLVILVIRHKLRGVNQRPQNVFVGFLLVVVFTDKSFHRCHLLDGWSSTKAANEKLLNDRLG